MPHATADMNPTSHPATVVSHMFDWTPLVTKTDPTGSSRLVRFRMRNVPGTTEWDCEREYTLDVGSPEDDKTVHVTTLFRFDSRVTGPGDTMSEEWDQLVPEGFERARIKPGRFSDEDLLFAVKCRGQPPGRGMYLIQRVSNGGSSGEPLVTTDHSLHHSDIKGTDLRSLIDMAMGDALLDLDDSLERWRRITTTVDSADT